MAAFDEPLGFTLGLMPIDHLALAGTETDQRADAARYLGVVDESKATSAPEKSVLVRVAESRNNRENVVGALWRRVELDRRGWLVGVQPEFPPRWRRWSDIEQRTDKLRRAVGARHHLVYQVVIGRYQRGVHLPILAEERRGVSCPSPRGVSKARQVRIGEGVTFTPKEGAPKRRKATRRRNSPVVTRHVPVEPAPAPNPAVAEEFGQSLLDLLTFEAMAGVRRPDRKKLIRTAAKYADSVAAEEVLLALIDDGWSVTDALQAAWNIPNADYNNLITTMVQRLGMTFPEVMGALRSIRIGRADLTSLIELRDLGSTPRRYR